MYYSAVGDAEKVATLFVRCAGVRHSFSEVCRGVRHSL